MLTLGEVAHIAMGQSPLGETVSNDNGIVLLNGPTEFGSHHPSPVQFTSDPRRLAEPDDILFCVRGSTTGRMNWADQEYAIGRGIAAIRHRTDPTLQPLIRGVIEFELPTLLAQATGSTFPNVSATQLAAIPFPSIDITEQRAIAHILGTLDDKIELNRQINQTLEEMAHAIYKDWFVDFGPTRAKLEGQEPYLPPELWDLFPERLVDWELGEIPEGWKVGKLQDVVTILDHLRIPLNSRQRAQRKGIYRYYGAAGILDYVDDFLFDGVHVLAGEDGSVVDRNGHPVTQYIWGQFWVNNHAHVLKGKMGYSDEHIYLLMQTQEIGAFVTGAVQPKLNQNNLKSIPIVVPSTYLLEAFRKAIQPMFGAIRSNSDETSMLTTQRDTLLPKLISGELRPEGSCITNEMSDIHG